MNYIKLHDMHITHVRENLYLRKWCYHWFWIGLLGWGLLAISLLTGILKEGV